MGDDDLRSEQSTSSFHTLLGQGAHLFSVLERFPVPLEVFSPDGLSLFVNKEFLHFFCIDDANEIVGKLNILHDPYIHQKLGLTDYLRRVFSGELLSLQDLRVPVEEIACRYKGEKNPLFEKEMYQDITCFPLWDENGTVVCVVTLFMLRHVYHSRLDIAKAKAYIENHWFDDFDQETVARVANASPDHLTRLFKQFTGKTPRSYYQELKVEKIKEALRDTNLSVREVFAACGTDYSSCFADVFKRKVGMTPRQYRKHLSEYPVQVQHYPSIPVCETEDRLFQVAALFPIPIQIFKQNGDIIFINEATFQTWNVQDSSKILGKYNLLKDPLVNEQFGLSEHIRRTFQGEVVLMSDLRIPLESFWAWYDARNPNCDIEAIYTDILNFTVWVKDVGTTYIVSIFLTRRLYQGRTSVTKAKEYLENHWQEDFDMRKLAQAIGLSPSHLARLFKKHTGITLYRYYQEIKINSLKVALRDRNLSIAEAFVSCGFEYSSNFTRFFKEKVGMTPSQYRETTRN